MNDSTAPTEPLERNVAYEIPSRGKEEPRVVTEVGPGEIIEWTVRRPKSLGEEPDDLGCGCGCGGVGGGGPSCGCSCV